MWSIELKTFELVTLHAMDVTFKLDDSWKWPVLVLPTLRHSFSNHMQFVLVSIIPPYINKQSIMYMDWMV